MPGRKPLFNAELQTDLDGKDFNIRNVNQIDVVQSGMVYVDPNLPDEIGLIDSLMAFKTIFTALKSAPPGYNIVLRPGIHSFDGIITINRSRIKIFGSGGGALIAPSTPNGLAGFLITGSFVELNGIVFDGGRTGSPSNTGVVIEVNRAANTILRNLAIRAQQGDGILLADDYSSTLIDNCSITDCNNGILATILTNHDINDVTISNNTIQNIRTQGINLQGNNVNRLGDVKITGNDVVNVNVDGAGASSVRMTGGLTNVIVANNYLSRGAFGVNCAQSDTVTVHSNSFAGFDTDMIVFNGCTSCTLNNNLLDGANPTTGSPQADIGINIFDSFNPGSKLTGPFVINSNLISGIIDGGRFFSISNAIDTVVSSNQMTANAYFYAQSFNNLKITSNIFTVGGNNPVISLDASTLGWNTCTIADNNFNTTGTRGRLISTNDTLATGQINISVVGNTSTQGATYAQDIFSNVNGAAPGPRLVQSNTPISLTRTAGEWDTRFGWVNDYQTILTTSHVNIPVDSFIKYQVGGAQVVGARITGWALPTGTQTRTVFDPSTVTLPDLAQRVNALIHDLHISTGHGLIGTTAGEFPLGYHYS